MKKFLFNLFLPTIIASPIISLVACSASEEEDKKRAQNERTQWLLDINQTFANWGLDAKRSFDITKLTDNFKIFEGNVVDLSQTEKDRFVVDIKSYQASSVGNYNKFDANFEKILVVAPTSYKNILHHFVVKKELFVGLNPQILSYTIEASFGTDAEQETFTKIITYRDFK